MQVAGGKAVQNKRVEADLDGEVENEMKKITYYFYCIHSDCTVCFITKDFLYCLKKGRSKSASNKLLFSFP